MSEQIMEAGFKGEIVRYVVGPVQIYKDIFSGEYCF